jgi:Flp pilus assembly protein TadD
VLIKLAGAGLILSSLVHSNDIFSEARTAQGNGNWAQAERLYRQVLESNPNSAETWNALGVVLNREERFQDAAAAFQKAVQFAPQVEGLKLNLGIALFRANQFSEAAKQLEKVQSQPQARQLLALALVETGDYNRAIGLLRELTRDSDDVSLHLALATAYTRVHRNADSEAAIAHMLSVVPDTAALHVALAKAYEQSFDAEHALAEYRKAAHNDPALQGVHLETGRLLWKDRKFDEAEPEFYAELKNNPAAIEAKYYLGAIYLYRGDTARAVPLLKEFVDAKPGEKNGQVELGRALLKENRYSEAISSFQKALALGPEDPNVHYLLGQAYRSAGRQQPADKEFEISRRLRANQLEVTNRDLKVEREKN